jgi:hypothetical protein
MKEMFLQFLNIFFRQFYYLYQLLAVDSTEIWCEDVEWVHLAQNGAQWQTLVNIVMKFWVSVKDREFD